MRIALAKSYNIAAVHLLDQVGVQTGAQMVRRFGITNPMAPSLPSALGASEASLLEMVSAYSTFPNKGVRVEPHLIRKVVDRDGKVLEQWEKTTYKVTSEYVALSMVDMMRGVTAPGGTAPGASAAGQPLAGKTGTVNDHTDVWFIGYTPSIVTGVWMGNPKRKTNLGNGMTGGHGALPYFNAFMGQFMKGKKIERFPSPPGIPAEIRSLVAQRKREELERLERADEAGEDLGANTNVDPGTAVGNPTGGPAPGTNPQTPSNTAVRPPSNPITRSSGGSQPSTKPIPAVKPPPQKPVAVPTPEGVRRKGKKGDT